MNERLTEEWVKKVMRDFEDVATKAAAETYYKLNHCPCARPARDRYEKSDKGKAARKKIIKTRWERRSANKVSRVERKMINRFYKECPKHLEIDHIIPLAKGGAHSLSNLQWIPKETNKKKHVRLLLKKDDYPQCLLRIKNGDI